MKVSAISGFNYSNIKNNIKKSVSFKGDSDYNPAYPPDDIYERKEFYGDDPENNPSSDSDYWHSSSDSISTELSKKDTISFDNITKETFDTQDEKRINLYRQLFKIYNETQIKNNYTNTDTYFDTISDLADKPDKEIKTQEMALKDITLINKYINDTENKKLAINIFKILKTDEQEGTKIRKFIPQIVKEFDAKKDYEKRQKELKEKQAAELKKLEDLKREKERELEEQKAKIIAEINILKEKHEKELAELK